MSVEIKIELSSLPKCPRCDHGELIPMYDIPYTPTAVPLTVYPKGWVCSNCGHNVFLIKGELSQQSFHPRKEQGGTI